jgi:hypothetical protein
VGVDESGEEGLAVEVDALGGCGEGLGYFGEIADGDDLVAANRDRVGVGILWVGGEDLGVEENFFAGGSLRLERRSGGKKEEWRHEQKNEVTAGEASHSVAFPKTVLRSTKQEAHTIHGERTAALFAADKIPSGPDRFHGGQQVGGESGFKNVAGGSQAESFLHYQRRRFLAHEENPGVGGEFANETSGVESIHSGESDVEENQVRVQFGGLLNGVESVKGFLDDLQAGFFHEDSANQFSEGFEVFDQENAECGTLHV